jgi:phenylacetic acid degradation operon negative regulatory protein
VPAQGAYLQLRAANVPVDTLVFEANLADPEAPGRLVGLGWDLNDLAKRYARFVQRFEPAHDVLRVRAADPGTGFILRTLLIHEYRRLHLRDPLLPRRLLPADWPGLRAADLCREIYWRVFAASEIHLSQVAAQLDGALPPPDRSIAQRFGGIASASL